MLIFVEFGWAFGVFVPLSFWLSVISNRFCAHEFEKSKDMATASLAYKCMEVAYMRVINFSHASASRDRLVLQTALQMIPSGNLNKCHDLVKLSVICENKLSVGYYLCLKVTMLWAPCSLKSQALHNLTSCCYLMSFLLLHYSGESPSSSASDLDNLNNSTTVDKLTLSKGVGSPQVAGNHVIAAQNRSNFTRLLSFVSEH